MTIVELKNMLNEVKDSDAEVYICEDGDTYYDGDPIRAMRISHNFVMNNENKQVDEVKVFLIK